MGDEGVVFLEGSLVEQQLDPFPRRQLALGVLRVDPLLPPAQAGVLAAVVQFLDNVLHRRPLSVWAEHTGRARPLKHFLANLQSLEIITNANCKIEYYMRKTCIRMDKRPAPPYPSFA